MTTVVRTLVGAAVGAAIGFAMYKFVGCRTGACPLTGNPYIAVFIWGVMGAIVASGR